MKYFNNILETIGNTPLVKLNRVLGEDFPCLALAKVEFFNPGNSVKDRMAVKMIEDAEKAGILKPGGTIIEGTSGNTGMGLAIAATIKGYKLICTTTDKQSKEKIDILKAMGAEVRVCPTNVAPDDPQSYYSVAKRLAEEIPNSFYPNQYDNPSNTQAHYETTGPEIWEQTDGKVTHFVVGVGTGGTISGVGRYLKEKNPNVKIFGIDTYGSVFKKYHETGIFDENEIYAYITEGIGEDILPANVDFSVIDYFEKVTDRDACIYTRELARQEGIFAGNSAGAVIAGLRQMKNKFSPDDVVVVLFHDHGSRYVGKMYNDEWMRERGFLEDECSRAIDLVQDHLNLPLVTVRSEELVSHAVERMRKFGISQIPVVDATENFVGSLHDADLFQAYFENKDIYNKPVREFMRAPFPIVSESTPIEEISKLINRDNPAVLVKLLNGKHQIITKHDIIKSIQ